MTICSACGAESTCSKDRVCLGCLYKLPIQTRKAFFSKQIDIKRVVEILKLRYASVKTLRGGRHTP